MKKRLRKLMAITLSLALILGLMPMQPVLQVRAEPVDEGGFRLTPVSGVTLNDGHEDDYALSGSTLVIKSNNVDSITNVDSNTPNTNSISLLSAVETITLHNVNISTTATNVEAVSVAGDTELTLTGTNTLVVSGAGTGSAIEAVSTNASVIIASGTVTATALGTNNPGIDATTITISGGRVTATGAGTGVGINGATTISGGTVVANGGFAGSLAMSGSPVVTVLNTALASLPGDASTRTGGILFTSEPAGTILGTTTPRTVTPTDDFTVPTEKTLTVPPQVTLAINDITMTNSGEVIPDNDSTISFTGGTLNGNPIDGANVTGPVTVSGTPTANSITVTAVTAAATTGQDVEYAAALVNDAAPTSGWVDVPTVSGLTADTVYYIYARTKANNNFDAGPTQVSEAIRTAASGGTTPPPDDESDLVFSGLRLSGDAPNQTLTFDAVDFGDDIPFGVAITITNEGDEATGSLDVWLSGTNATNNFALTPGTGSTQSGDDLTIDDISEDGGTVIFNIRPKAGLNANTHTATVNVGTKGTSVLASFTVEFTVNKIAPTVDDLVVPNIAGLDHTYDRTAQGIGTVTANPTSTGLGTTITVYYNNGTVNTTTPPTNAGEYTVTATISEGTNYLATLSPLLLGTYEIKKHELSWSNNGLVQTRPYNGDTDATVANWPRLDDVYAGDTVNIIRGTITFDSKNAGISQSVTAIGFGIADHPNYLAPSDQPDFQPGVITPLQLTWDTTGTVVSKTYNRQTDATAATHPGFLGVIAGDDVTVQNGTITFNDWTVGTVRPVTATNYGIAPGGDGGNYLAPVNQPVFLTGTINPVQLTWTPGTVVSPRPYDGTAVATIVTMPTLSGVVAGDTVNFTPGTARFENDGVVGADLAVTGVGFAVIPGGDMANYTAPVAQPSFGTDNEIEAKVVRIPDQNLTFLANASGERDFDLRPLVANLPGTKSFVAGDTTGTNTAIISGTPAPDASTGELIFTLVAGNANDTATIPVTISGITNHANIIVNVVVTYVDATKTIVPVTVTAPTTGLVYGDTLGDPSAAATGVTGTGDGAFTFTYSGTMLNGSAYNSPGAPSDPGTYYVTATVLGTNETHAGSGISAPFTIAPKPLEWADNGVVADRNYSRFNTVTPSSQPTLSGVEAADTGNVESVVGTVRFETANAGEGIALIVNDYRISGANAWKYTVPNQQPVFNAGTNTANINKVDITITGVTAVDRDYGGGNIVEMAGGTLNSLLSGDENAVSFILGTGHVEDWDANDDIPVIYDVDRITLTGPAAINYNLTTVNNGDPITVNITQANPVITWPTSFTLVAGQTLADAKPVGGTLHPEAAGQFVFASPAETPTIADSGELHEIQFVPTNTQNWTSPINQNMPVIVTTASGGQQTPPPDDTGGGGGGGGGSSAPAAPAAPSVNYGTSAMAMARWRTLNNTVTRLLGASDTPFNHVVRTGRTVVVPTTLLDTLRGTPGTVMMNTGAGVTYSVSGANIPTGETAAIDLSLRTGRLRAPSEVVSAATSGSRTSVQIPMASRDAFGFTVNMHFNFGAATAGRSANLFRFNEATGVFEYLGSFEINERGQAMFGIGEGADYLVTVTDTAPDLPIVRGMLNVGSGPATGTVHTVAPGETMSRIAQRYGITLARLRELNPGIANINFIRVGQTIRVG